jgi:hypothetical protein
MSYLLTALDTERCPDWLTKLQDEFTFGYINGCKPMARWNCVTNFKRRPTGQRYFESGSSRFLYYRYVIRVIDYDGVLAEICLGYFNTRHVYFFN